jgi:hypothetical protein
MNQRRSKLEQDFEKILQDLNINYTYESTIISYIIPESSHKYKVDWSFDKPIFIETKGWLSSSIERKKYELIKKQYPNLDLRFIFANPNKYCGGTKYSHATWAKKQGFKYCSINDYETIKEWLS